ncbi:hypothetical protein [Cupriavidus plantarum]|uniref:hypothetical protein n=1 Tax=Cupriavidus plantarum TaxID=942865 RepID=UPI001B12FAC5|nr:hypothetical protein [Cupriavidus plantarum]CAG2139417.1 hypothetical protein LMG26296_02871 [Cupriavidus plantarum]SMR85722.1 hypothetical protein SAMN05421735_4532 [Cupriavidus plantarum]
MFVDRIEIINAAKALRASQEESKYNKLVALANKQLKAMQAAIQKGKEEFETTLVLDINEEHPQAALGPRVQRLADDLRSQGYTATVSTFADVSADRKNWTPNITVTIGLGDLVADASPSPSPASGEASRPPETAQQDREALRSAA